MRLAVLMWCLPPGSASVAKNKGRQDDMTWAGESRCSGRLLHLRQHSQGEHDHAYRPAAVADGRINVVETTTIGYLEDPHASSAIGRGSLRHALLLWMGYACLCIYRG